MKLSLLVVLIAIGATATAAAVLWFRERWRREAYSAEAAQSLLHPARRLIQSPARVVQAFGLRQGDTVVELGPGPGYFTDEAAAAVGPSGRVICVDLQRDMLLALRGHVASGARIDLVVGEAGRLPIRSGALDGAFLVSMLGEVPDPDAAVRELARALRPAGVASFCETFNDPDYVRLTVLRRLCRNAGLDQRDWRRQLLGYIARFERHSTPV